MIFLMDLPKPVHGMSNVNLAVKNEAMNKGLEPLVINSVPSYAAKLFTTKWWGIVKILHTALCFFKLFYLSLSNVKGVFYRPINGGSGQAYDIIYLAIARLFHNKIYIHHHSFNYLNNKSNLFTIVNKVAGKSATHIVLGGRMKNVLSELYNIDESTIYTISNLAYFNNNPVEVISENNKIRIGHLANLCAEKGADVFIDVCKELEQKNVDFLAKIAGPFVDNTTKELVLDAVKNIQSLHYLGPLYSEDKVNFYQCLDCFIFPSKYINEAEPLVLFEAAESSTLLIGSQRGCMKDVIDSLNGFSLPECDELSSHIVNSIVEAIQNNDFDLEVKKGRQQLFKNEHIKATGALTLLMDEMKKNDLPKA